MAGVLQLGSEVKLPVRRVVTVWRNERWRAMATRWFETAVRRATFQISAWDWMISYGIDDVSRRPPPLVNSAMSGNPKEKCPAAARRSNFGSRPSAMCRTRSPSSLATPAEWSGEIGRKCRIRSGQVVPMSKFENSSIKTSWSFINIISSSSGY
jgi:hypothetical protein